MSQTIYKSAREDIAGRFKILLPSDREKTAVYGKYQGLGEAANDLCSLCFFCFVVVCLFFGLLLNSCLKLSACAGLNKAVCVPKH